MKKITKSLPYLLLAFAFLSGTVALYAGNIRTAVRKIQTIKQAPIDPNTTKTAKKIKLALLLDTSGSMDGLIDQAKSQFWTIVNELAAAKCDGAKPEVKIALYEYGNDGLPASEGYIRLVTPLTNDLDKLSQDLFALKTNGGSEFCGHVIQTASRQLDWSADGGDLQIIFIAGNEPFTQGSINYQIACEEAKKKNIIVNTIFCGDFQEGINTSWKSGADLTSGSYASIEQNSKTVFTPSPYDDKIDQLNTQLNNTYIEYGTEGKKRKEAQATQDAESESYGAANKVNRAVSKSTHVYQNKSWDMVDAAEDKSFDVTKVTKNELPQAMKNMSDDQKKSYVKQKTVEREKIKVEIQELNRKRTTFLLAQKKDEKENMLDKSMINSIKAQAEKNNFKF
ncbi:MAG: VWA domain-containing protein [Cytophagaceae bacterium]|nr:VWA domain-containing protein [Cytophagaceae bacterium]